jgi:putative component of toxin-antitoxin plasmid stabilization module
MPNERLLKKLETSDGTIPFDDWYLSLKDKKTRAVIAARLLLADSTWEFGGC